MTTTEAAARLHVRRATIRQAIKQGRLNAVKVGRDWHIEEAEIERYQQDRRTWRQKGQDDD